MTVLKPASLISARLPHLLGGFLLCTLLGQMQLAHADALLVCKATENAFDALDNNCDGEVDDKEELENIGKITGSDWYLDASAPLNANSLCSVNNGVVQCQSRLDNGNCSAVDGSSNYLCNVSGGTLNTTSSGSNGGAGSSGTSPGNTNSGTSNNSSPNTGNNGAGTVTPTNVALSSGDSNDGDKSSANNNGEETDPNSQQSGPDQDICLIFSGIEKCLSTVDNGNSCELTAAGLFYCASQPNPLPEPGFCVPSNEVFNGIDDNCNGEIDEGVEPILVSNDTASAANESDVVAVSAPASLALFGLGLAALFYTRKKQHKAKN